MRHQACSNCGKYRGKVVINLEKKTTKLPAKTSKKSDKKEKKTEAK